MYQRDIACLPIIISRDDFVEIVFDIGLRHRHGYDTIVAAVDIGDRFVSFPNKRFPYIGHIASGNDITKKNLMEELVPQVYSNELAYAVSVIAAKANEDHGYKYTEASITDTNNRYVLKIEWEICMLSNFSIKVHNFITIIGKVSCAALSNERAVLASCFWDLSKQICMNPDIMNMNPLSIVIGIFILHKHGKLQAFHDHKKRIFTNTMLHLSNYYELSLTDVLMEYISIKNVN